MNLSPSEPQQASALLTFDWPIRVYYEDTDAGGIVFYANFLKFFERARTEWLRACGIDQRRLADSDGVLFVVKRTALDYSAPARLDDIIHVVSRIVRLGGASVDFHQEAWRDGVLLASGDIRVASVSFAAIRPVAIPASVVAGLRNGPCTQASQPSRRNHRLTVFNELGGNQYQPEPYKSCGRDV